MTGLMGSIHRCLALSGGILVVTASGGSVCMKAGSLLNPLRGKLMEEAPWGVLSRRVNSSAGRWSGRLDKLLQKQVVRHPL